MILENPSTFSRTGLKGPMVAIGSKIYSLGEAPNDESIFALYELDTGENLIKKKYDELKH